MLQHVRAPLFVGSVAILVLATVLIIEDPLPGGLAAGHAAVPELGRLGGCARCHSEGGIGAGCLQCHDEIARQLETASGHHQQILEGQPLRCTGCHGEHYGSEFQVAGALAWGDTPREEFDHSFTTFTLTGRHDELACDSCHRPELGASAVLSAFPDRQRAHTYLGLEQECVSCHVDIHAGGLASHCTECHGQDSFRPAIHFDHDASFPLGCAHRAVECRECHPAPAAASADLATAARGFLEALLSDEPGRSARLSFEDVRGTECVDCHPSPHRAELGGDCASCHRPDACRWQEGSAAMEPGRHGVTGFPLVGPHRDVPCDECHPSQLSFAERYPDPAAPEYRRTPDRCEGCHRDVHGGQFAASAAGCLSCHERDRFRPSRFDGDRHREIFPLEGAHAVAACQACHRADEGTGILHLSGTSRECADCHPDPHAGQFQERAGDCGACHDSSHFVPTKLGLADHTTFALDGAHSAVPCEACHRLDEDSGAQLFVGTSRSCKACHADPHGGQFAPELERGDCSQCHAPDGESFSVQPFDHQRETGYALTGAHAEISCRDCHRRSVGATGESFRIYRGTPDECASCHRDPHLGQFGTGSSLDCQRCHGSSAAWSADRFAHDRDSRFPLDSAHVRVPCASCHPAATSPTRTPYIHFKPLGTRCEDCHKRPNR